MHHAYSDVCIMRTPTYASCVHRRMHHAYSYVCIIHTKTLSPHLASEQLPTLAPSPYHTQYTCSNYEAKLPSQLLCTTFLDRLIRPIRIKRSNLNKSCACVYTVYIVLCRDASMYYIYIIYTEHCSVWSYQTYRDYHQYCYITSRRMTVYALDEKGRFLNLDF